MLVNIQKSVPTTIFELPKIKLRVDELFNFMEGDIEKRFNQIKTFLTKNGFYDVHFDTISYDQIANLFKICFYKSILNEVVEILFTEEGKYDVVSNILDLLSKEKLAYAILGEPMVYAFELAIRTLPSDGSITALCIQDAIILCLKKEFLK